MFAGRNGLRQNALFYYFLGLKKDRIFNNIQYLCKINFKYLEVIIYSLALALKKVIFQPKGTNKLSELIILQSMNYFEVIIKI